MGAGNGSGFPDCIKSILENAALYLLENADGLVLDSDELIDIFGNNIYNTDFPAGRKSTLIQYLKDLVGFSSDAETWLLSYERPMSFTVEFYKFLRGEGFSTEATTTLGSVFGFLHSKSFDESSSAAAEAVVSLLASDKLRGPYTDAERDAIVLEHFSNDPDFYIEYITQCLLLRHEYEQNNPGQECGLLCEAQIALEAFWRVKSGLIHTAFDICGLVPFAGEPCDLVNGTLYVIEGDGVNASLSFAASLPFLGWPATGLKYAKIIVDSAAGAIELTVKKGAGGLIKFPLPSGLSFRQIVGVTDPLEEAHHLIPQSTLIKEHPIVQAAASANRKTFHIHHPKNGMACKKFRVSYQPDGIHANHPNYNAQVKDKLDDMIVDLENEYGVGLNQVNPEVISQRLIDFQNSLRSLIQANPSTKINDLVIP